MSQSAANEVQGKKGQATGASLGKSLAGQARRAKRFSGQGTLLSAVCKNGHSSTV
jgi:hypothetical protein